MKVNWKKIKQILFFASSVSILFSISVCIDRQLVPKLKEISHMQCRSFANHIIDLSIKTVMEELNLREAVLLTRENNGDGYMANTVYITDFCTRFSEDITERMLNIPEEQIHIPLGAITNLSFFANKGPDIPFSLLPAGAAKINYASNFQSVGINQINYKIWLDVTLEMKIVNPFYEENIIMKRKIMMADIVFSGKVPEQYFHLSSPDEYLLTE